MREGQLPALSRQRLCESGRSAPRGSGAPSAACSAMAACRRARSAAAMCTPRTSRPAVRVRDASLDLRATAWDATLSLRPPTPRHVILGFQHAHGHEV